MCRRTLALEPLPDRSDVAAEGRWRLAHVDPERAIDRRVADTKAENEASLRGIGDERSTLGTDIRVSQIDVRNPRSHGNASRRRPHELSRRHHIVVHFCCEDRVEPGSL